MRTRAILLMALRYSQEQGATGMKKPSSKIRTEIAKLQEQLKAAETREAERIGRLALKAGLGDLDIEEPKLLQAFGELANRFRGGGPVRRKAMSAADATRAASGADREA